MPLYQSSSSVSPSWPITAIRRTPASGSSPSLRSSTNERRAASLASAWCSGQLTTLSVTSSYGVAGSNSPSRNLIDNVCRTARSTSASASRPCASASRRWSRVAWERSSSWVKLSIPALTACAYASGSVSW
ncbi:hypothetical protein ABGB18_32830 [Nonomuraea sp. B12E4]|uniref:hypothetical protein n=1 Tax=Nonomuraea sp. B12E4 TaxID=3153564 RepID=UPI00325CFD33